MQVARRLLIRLLVVGVVGFGSYFVYAVYEGSRQLVHPGRSADCRTPDLFGWVYEAINYDAADDAVLAAYPDRSACASQGAPAGDEVVTADGIRIAGWYIPAGNGDPYAPTIVFCHGIGANKSHAFGYVAGLHESFNVVAFDFRNGGRSSGTETTMGVREADDLRAILDWLEREKGVNEVGVLANSMGAAAASALARTDARIVALALDSAHARFSTTALVRLNEAGHLGYPGLWAVFFGTWLRTGVWADGADSILAIPDLVGRPLLLLHGTVDVQNAPADSAEVLLAAAQAAGISVELIYCPGAHHGGVDETCAGQYGGWVTTFFDAALR